MNSSKGSKLKSVPTGRFHLPASKGGGGGLFERKQRKAFILREKKPNLTKAQRS